MSGGPLSDHDPFSLLFPARVVLSPVRAEIFAIWLAGDRLTLVDASEVGRWCVDVEGDQHPVDVVVAHLRAQSCEPRLVHSTSWRRIDRAVVLSFIVVVDAEQVRHLPSVAVERADLARCQPTGWPAAVAAAQVVEHGLRHLAWLVRDDPVVASALADGWPDVLDAYRPEPFRALTHSGFPGEC